MRGIEEGYGPESLRGRPLMADDAHEDLRKGQA
jgi:hypothetical protein